MAKAEALTPDALSVVSVTAPKAATPARGVTAPAKPERVKVDHIPLQLRLPPDEVRAIKIAAVNADQSISEFMLACFHASMQTTKK